MRTSRKSKAANVGVLTKVLRIFDALQHNPAGLNLKQISEQTHLNKSTAYRFLAHLDREGYLVRDERGLYMLGMRLFELASSSNHQFTLRKVAGPELHRLLKITGETVNLGVLHGLTVVYVEVLESSHEFRLVSQVGLHRPLYATSLGKALTAFLPPAQAEELIDSIQFQQFTPHTIATPSQFRSELEKIRERGFAVDNEESYLGARCIGAPILNSTHQAIAAISIAGPTSRISEDKIPPFAAAIREAAHTISQQIGFSQPEPLSSKRNSEQH